MNSRKRGGEVRGEGKRREEMDESEDGGREGGGTSSFPHHITCGVDASV